MHEIFYYPDGTKQKEIYYEFKAPWEYRYANYIDGWFYKFHREDGPAVIKYHKNGNVKLTKYFAHGAKKALKKEPFKETYDEDGELISKIYCYRIGRSKRIKVRYFSGFDESMLRKVKWQINHDQIFETRFTWYNDSETDHFYRRTKRQKKLFKNWSKNYISE